MKIFYLLLCMPILIMGCSKENKWPDPPEIPEELVFEEFSPGVNTVIDSGFENSDLTENIVESYPVPYNKWSWYNTIAENTVIKIVESSDQGKVLEITNASNGISSTNYNQAYAGQRILAKATPSIYKLSFKARKNSTENGTLRTFVFATGENGAIIKKFFVFHPSDTAPTEIVPSDRKYTLFCQHHKLTDEWKTYVTYVNMGRTTEATGSVEFGSSNVSTEEDLKAYVVCFSSSLAESCIQIDDVEFSLLEVEPEEPLTTPEIGVNFIADPGFDNADLEREIMPISPVIYNEWGVNNILDDYSFAIETDKDQGKIAQITVGETSVSSANLLNAFMGQRVYVKAASDIYKLTYKARNLGGTGTLRIFVPVTDDNGIVQKKFFAVHYNNNDPYAETPGTQKYTIHCRHEKLSAEWTEYHCYFDMRRVTTKTASTTFDQTLASEDIDLEKFLLCFSSSVADSVIQIDDITFSRIEPKTE